MRLTLYTDYALRVLIFVGANRDAISTIDAVAAGYGISKNHLRKVVHDLSRHGFLETHQGRKGGIRLGRPPESISVGAVVRAMEQDRGIAECFDPTAPYCRIQPACALRRLLEDALESFLQTLDRYTIADIIRPRHALAELLAIPLPSAGGSRTSSARPARRPPRRPSSRGKS